MAKAKIFIAGNILGWSGNAELDRRSGWRSVARLYDAHGTINFAPVVLPPNPIHSGAAPNPFALTNSIDARLRTLLHSRRSFLRGFLQ